MRLIELEPQFVKLLPTNAHRHVATLAEADGIYFLCPKCFEKIGSNVGCHQMLCWFRNKVPDSLRPGPGRWTPCGTGYNDLSFVAGEPPQLFSVQAGECGHYHLENGEIKFC